MFESSAPKRSSPRPFTLPQAVLKSFYKAYTHAPDEYMGTVSFFATFLPYLKALLTAELFFHQYKCTFKSNPTSYTVNDGALNFTGIHLPPLGVKFPVWNHHGKVNSNDI